MFVRWLVLSDVTGPISVYSSTHSSSYIVVHNSSSFIVHEVFIQAFTLVSHSEVLNE